jgi:hypothetical protein
MNAGKRERVHLLLSAGGVRCLSYIGALEQLEQEGFEIATVSTCSAGTLVGALYCAGVAPGAMREAALDLNLRRFAGDARWNWLRRKPSSLWAPAIEDAIKRAVVDILLVSERFEESDFIQRVERPLLREQLPQGRLLCISIDGTLPSGPEAGLQLFGDATGLTRMGETAAADTFEPFGRLIEQTYRAAAAAA